MAGHGPGSPFRKGTSRSPLSVETAFGALDRPLGFVDRRWLRYGSRRLRLPSVGSERRKNAGPSFVLSGELDGRSHNDERSEVVLAFSVTPGWHIDGRCSRCNSWHAVIPDFGPALCNAISKRDCAAHVSREGRGAGIEAALRHNSSPRVENMAMSASQTAPIGSSDRFIADGGAAQQLAQSQAKAAGLA